MNNEQRADLLEEAITILDDSYWIQRASPVLPTQLFDSLQLKAKRGQAIPDPLYDQMRLELKQLRPDSTVFDTTFAGKLEIVGKKVKHNPPMVSIDKACDEDPAVQEQQLFKWLDDCVQEATVAVKNGPVYDLNEKRIDGIYHARREYKGKVVLYPRDYFCMSDKLDGLGVAINYVKGKLDSAGLRPRDGINGEDVTERVPYVNGVPRELKLPLTCSIRGEIVCLKQDFAIVQSELQQAGKPLRKNARNHAAGGIAVDDPKEVASKRLTFIAYSIEGLANPPYKSEIERAKFCAKELGIKYVYVRLFNFYELAKIEEESSGKDYKQDGVVLCVNDLEAQEQLGRRGDAVTGTPKGKLAWKFTEEKADASIEHIEWATGRTGSIIPVATFTPVLLAETMVGRVTLHNLGFMIRNGIGLGTTLTIIKSGNIIPKVIGVKGKRVKEVDYPKICPSCGQKTSVEQTPAHGQQLEMHDLVCNNQTCSAKNVNNLLHYLSTFGVLGLGDSRVAALLEGGKVSKPSDFYKLTLDDVMSCGLSERQALLVLAAIHMIPSPEKVQDNKKLCIMIEKAKKYKKIVPLWRLFACLGIESAGKSAGKALVEHFKDFEVIRKASVQQLSEVNEIGAKTAELIFAHLKNNSGEITELLKYVEPELPKVGPLSGRLYVFSGSFPEGKSHWEKKVEELGGKCSGSVGKKTTFLVVGPGAGSKTEQAAKYGVPTLSLEELCRSHIKN
jgi:DNA ligase (NAD+)